MKILESYKKMAKSMLTENVWDRKFGEPLPTIQDVIWRNMTEEEQNAHLNVVKEASQDDDDYVHIGYGKYKEKNMVDDPQAPTYSKNPAGAFVLDKEDDKKDSKDGDDKETPKGAGLDSDDFERDFDRDANRAADDEADDMDRDARFAADAEDDEDAKAAAFADMEDEFGDDDMDEGHGKIITINGKKYKQVEKKPIDASHCS